MINTNGQGLASLNKINLFSSQKRLIDFDYGQYQKRWFLVKKEGSQSTALTITTHIILIQKISIFISLT